MFKNWNCTSCDTASAIITPRETLIEQQLRELESVAAKERWQIVGQLVDPKGQSAFLPPDCRSNRVPNNLVLRFVPI